MQYLCDTYFGCCRKTKPVNTLSESILPNKNTIKININVNKKSDKDINSNTNLTQKQSKAEIASVKSSINVKHATFFDFKKIAMLGKGAYGTVYLVQYRENKKYYAMKVLKKDLIKKLKQTKNTKTEREILEKISHPFIISLYHAFQNSDGLFMVTEFLQGGDLFFLLKKHGTFTIDQIRFYSAEIILGLIHLHSNNIIYRDLKLENVLLDKTGHIKLIDFGLSKICTRIFEPNEENSINEMEATSFCGTNNYIAPEILVGKKYDSSVDWWSLGILIYEMAEGQAPFKLNKRDLIQDSYYNVKENIVFKVNTCIQLHNLIINLLEIDCEKRLGYGAKDFSFIKDHEFFSDINWDDIYNKKVEPEFKPIINSEDDTNNFDSRFTNQTTLDVAGDDSFSLFPKVENDHYDNFSFDDHINTN